MPGHSFRKWPPFSKGARHETFYRNFGRVSPVNWTFPKISTCIKTHLLTQLAARTIKVSRKSHKWPLAFQTIASNKRKLNESIQPRRDNLKLKQKRLQSVHIQFPQKSDIGGFDLLTQLQIIKASTQVIQQSKRVLPLF